MTEMNNTCCTLMKPLFYNGMFNRDGRRMRAVFDQKYRTEKKLSASIGKTENQTSNIRERKRINTCCMWNRTVIWFRCDARSIKW